MALLRCDFESKELQMQTTIQVAFPEDADLKKLPVIYLLHGLSDNSSGWQRRVPVERYALQYKVVVVMPEVQRSWYTDMVSGLSYFSYIHKELPAICHRLFGLSKKREQKYVVGLSMGGYGAMKCALTQPFGYTGCASFSGVMRMDEYPNSLKPGSLMAKEWNAVAGGTAVGKGPVADLQKLAAKAVSKGKKELPQLYITCGTEDFLLDANRSYNAYLEGLAYPHEYEEWGGDHTWEFWQQSLEKALERFFG